MWQYVTFMQSKLAEMCFWFKKIEEIIHTCEKKRYNKVATEAAKVVKVEKGSFFKLSCKSCKTSMLFMSLGCKNCKKELKNNYRPDHVEKTRVNFRMEFVCEK